MEKRKKSENFSLVLDYGKFWYNNSIRCIQKKKNASHERNSDEDIWSLYEQTCK